MGFCFSVCLSVSQRQRGRPFCGRSSEANKEMTDVKIFCAIRSKQRVGGGGGGGGGDFSGTFMDPSRSYLRVFVAGGIFFLLFSFFVCLFVCLFFVLLCVCVWGGGGGRVEGVFFPVAQRWLTVF